MRELYPTSSSEYSVVTNPSTTIPVDIVPLDIVGLGGVSVDLGGSDSPASEAVPWYALAVKHQHERAIEAALVYKGFEAFSPMYRSRRQWSDRTKEIDVPLFSGYVFCRFSQEAKARVLNTPAISRVVEFGGRPAPVADADIEAIRAIVTARAPVRPWPHLKPGDRVRVERGPLRGVEGVLLRGRDAVELIVSVELLQRSVAVRVDAASVVPVTGLCRSRAAHLRL
jgi:transcription antitermination factor NusG